MRKKIIIALAVAGVVGITGLTLVGGMHVGASETKKIAVEKKQKNPVPEENVEDKNEEEQAFDDQESDYICRSGGSKTIKFKSEEEYQKWKKEQKKIKGGFIKWFEDKPKTKGSS